MSEQKLEAPAEKFIAMPAADRERTETVAAALAVMDRAGEELLRQGWIVNWACSRQESEYEQVWTLTAKYPKPWSASSDCGSREATPSSSLL